MLKLGKSDNPLHLKVSNYTAKMTLMNSEFLESIWSADLMFEVYVLESTHTGKIIVIVGRIVDSVSPALHSSVVGYRHYTKYLSVF